MQIRNFYSEKLIYENENINSMRELVEEAIRNKISLANANLMRLDLSHGNFEGGDFRRAQINFTNFDSAQLTDANFKMASLFYTNFSSAKGTNVNFETAQMEYGIFIFASFSESNFSRSFMNLTNMENGNFIKCDFSRAEMQYANMDSGNFSYSEFKRANMRRANLLHTVFFKSNMENVILTDAFLIYENYKADFKGAYNLDSIICDENQIKLELQKNLDFLKGCEKNRKVRNIIYWKDIEKSAK